MTTDNLWLAFDIGTTATKAALLTNEGVIIRSVSKEYPLYAAEGGVVEQNAEDWWKTAIEACRELLQDRDADKIAHIAITGQMQDVILVDAAANSVYPVILYSDTRARAEADEINQKIGADRLRDLTGNEQDAGSLLAKLLWLMRHQPAVLASTHHLLLGAADFIALKMTGRAVTDSTTAATTGLMNLHERATLDHAVFQEIGITGVGALLPKISSGGTEIGKLSDVAAALLGIKASIPVHHGPGDAGAATLGAGSGEAGRVYAYLGTSGWIAFTSSERASAEQGAFTLAHPKNGAYIQIAPLLTAGGNLEWVRDLFGDDDYDTMIAKALQRPPSSLLYLPYLSGERSPFRDPMARGAFIGLNIRTHKEDCYRAVLEGVVFAYRQCMDTLLKTPVDTLVITGGGTRSQLWCQLFADITQIPVAIAADAENVGVRGAVLAARVASGDLTTYAVEGYFPVKMTLQPDPQYASHFDRQYLRFQALYPALRSTFAEMTEPQSE